MIKVAMILNMAIFTYGGYLYGNYQGTNTPCVDTTAIEKAIFLSMMEK